MTETGIRTQRGAVRVHLTYEDLREPLVSELANLLDGTGLLLQREAGGTPVSFAIHGLPGGMALEDIRSGEFVYPPVRVQSLYMASPLDVVLYISASGTTAAVLATNILSLMRKWQAFRKDRAEAQIAENNAELHSAATDFLINRLRNKSEAHVAETSSDELDKMAAALMSITDLRVEEA